MKTNLKSRPCGNPKREFVRAHAHYVHLCFWGINGIPLGPDPNPKLGRGRGPPGQSFPGGHVGIP